MGVSTAAPWRHRLSELARGAGKPHPPLFAPLLYGVASQIEALPRAEVTCDPTRLVKGLVELRRALGTSHLTTAAPAAMEAEALGAVVDRELWPPRVTAPPPAGIVELAEFDDVWPRCEALAASLEATKRLAATEPADTPILAALTGPARLATELAGRASPDDADAVELAGRALAGLARAFALAGAAALLLCEASAPAGVAGWSAALATIGNVARFHRIPLLLAFTREEPTSWPSSLVPCAARPGDAAAARPHGIVVSPDWTNWSAAAIAPRAQTRIVVTAEEVAADASIDDLQIACEEALAIEREAGGS